MFRFGWKDVLVIFDEAILAIMEHAPSWSTRVLGWLAGPMKSGELQRTGPRPGTLTGKIIASFFDPTVRSIPRLCPRG